MCPLLSDVLSFPTELFDADGGQPSGSYFNRTDVKKAMHAPLDSNWAICSEQNVYVGGTSGPESEGDNSADPIQKVLPQVIEATNRVLVGNGDFDMIIITNGTLMSIQVSHTDPPCHAARNLSLSSSTPKLLSHNQSQSLHRQTHRQAQYPIHFIPPLHPSH